jgi:hypothetical protein
MLPRDARSHNTTKVTVTVTDLPAVQRVLALLTGRQYQVTRFNAEEFGAGRWRTSFDLMTSAAQGQLLTDRLHRIPSVLLVDVERGRLSRRARG